MRHRRQLVGQRARQPPPRPQAAQEPRALQRHRPRVSPQPFQHRTRPPVRHRLNRWSCLQSRRILSLPRRWGATSRYSQSAQSWASCSCSSLSLSHAGGRRPRRSTGRPESRFRGTIQERFRHNSKNQTTDPIAANRAEGCLNEIALGDHRSLAADVHLYDAPAFAGS